MIETLKEEFDDSVEKMDEILLKRLMDKSGMPKRAAKRVLSKWLKKASNIWNKKIKIQGFESAVNDLELNAGFIELLNDSGMGEHLHHSLECIDMETEEHKKDVFRKFLNSKV